MDNGYAILGDLLFRVLVGWEDFEASRSVSYPEHAVIEGKPKLQYTGDGLETLTLSLRVHISYCDPDFSISHLRKRMDAHKAMPLILANGYYRGRYVITDLVEILRHTDHLGNTLLADLRLTLKEWAGTDSQETGEAVVVAGDPVPGASLWDATADVAAALEAEGTVSAVTAMLARAAELGRLGLSALADVLAAASDLATAIGLGVPAVAALAQVAAGVLAETDVGDAVRDFLAALPEFPAAATAMAGALAVGADVLVAGMAAVSQALDGDLTQAGQIFNTAAGAVFQALGGNLAVYAAIRDTVAAYAAGADPLVGLRALLRVA